MLQIIMAASSPSLAHPDSGAQQPDACHHGGDGDLCADDKARVDA